MSTFYDEDEDVIIQGSALQEHLCDSGYRDFETVNYCQMESVEETKVKTPYYVTFVNGMFRNLYSVYLWITQESDVSRKQLQIISNMKALLDDHALLIHGSLTKHHCISWRRFLQNTFTIGIGIFPIGYVSCKCKNILCIIFASCSIFYISQRMYLRSLADKKLQSLVNLQNDLYYLCKNSLKILRHGYKLKLGSEKTTKKFSDLTAESLKYLQPLLENLIEFMEHASGLYYKTSLLIVNLLPTNIKTENFITILDPKFFKLKGEINYQILKQLHNTYILVQSEMLQLLAIAYDIDTWRTSYRTIPEIKLIYIIQTLIEQLTVYKKNLSEVTDAYCNHKIEPVRYEFKGQYGSKWQDLYTHLDLTSHKIQLAYSYIQSILKKIDVSTTENQDDREEMIIEEIMVEMNKAYKEIDMAKNFAEFSSLLIAKTRLGNKKEDVSIENVQNMQNVNSNRSVVFDTEPEIIDEVFEEYIKEEYIKPLYEGTENELFHEHRFDNLLTKNFMSELKEALVDKHKSMSQRESKALQRMYKNVLRDAHADREVNNDPNSTDPKQIPPPPPPLPSSQFPFSCNEKTMQTRDGSSEDQCKRHEEDTGKMIKENNSGAANVNYINSPTKRITKDRTLSAELLEINPQTLISMKNLTNSFPRPFLKIEEETFADSGEDESEHSDVAE